MGTITALGLILLICMVAVGGSQGLQAWISLIFNFGALFFAMVLMAFHLPPVLVTLVTGIIVLAMTIFLGGKDSTSTMVAFYASVAVLILLVIIIIPVEHWAQIQGFGQEDSEDLEGMSTILGIIFLCFSNFFELYFTPTVLLRKKFSLKKNTTMSNKHFVLGGVVKVITFGFFRTTNEVAFIRFRSKLISKHTFDISIRTSNYQKRQIWNISSPHLIWSLLN